MGLIRGPKKVGSPEFGLTIQSSLYTPTKNDISVETAVADKVVETAVTNKTGKTPDILRKGSCF